jgi:hypothetical protein
MPGPTYSRSRRTLTLFFVMLSAALPVGCSTSGTSAGPSAESVAPDASEPPSSAAREATPNVTPEATKSSAPPSATSMKLTDATHGLSIELPSGWVGITPGDISNTARLDELRALSSDETVATLVRAFQGHPEYWMGAMRAADGVVMFGQLREMAYDEWVTQQEAALKSSYGDVTRVPVTEPKEGVSFWFNSGQNTGQLYGFERPGGVALFTMAGKPDGAASWLQNLATFTDAGL